MSERRADDVSRAPIAIIGIGCHFPGGATGPEAFWDMLCAGVDATREVPADRWEVRKFYDPDAQKSGKMNTMRGGYLDRIDEFDAHFFGISPREAVWLDPQQRLLLQVAWEALEDGGQVVERLAGSDTGVFVGGFTLDYQLLQNYGVYSRYQLRSHSATGMMMTMLANRLSYTFDFRGPSVAIDTACSGSLVATHLAAQSIWNGECSLALAGGANVMIAPNMTIAEVKGGFLGADGRCKTFDASADGYARGEGAGVVLLKPLAAALADGDPVYALIRGTAVTQDGRTNGITVPNQVAQETAMRTAYRRAGVAPHEIQYVEAHGTGTPVGDPIEARAIGNVLSAGRPDPQRCVIGSVKTNIGHLEAAAGVAGLTKVVLSLAHRQIPPHLHLRDPNPDIPFDELQLRVATALEAWPDTDAPRRAGVNSFGFGGTNAHVVVEEAPPRAARQPRVVADQRPYLLPLSARSPEALTALAQRYRDFLAQTPHQLTDIGYTASLRRDHHDHRLAIVAGTNADVVEALDAFLADRPQPGVTSGRVAPTGPAKVAFVCSGMGPQWWAMARELLATEPVFRAEIERCDAELRQYTGWSLMVAMLATEDESRMAETEVAQPANFALQLGLAALWRSWGIEPDAVIGHSTGEVAAQYLAGVLSFQDAVKVNYYRSSLQQRTTGLGRMLAVGMTPETLRMAVDDAGPLVSIAAINSPSAVTLAGDAEILQGMAAQLETFGVFHRFLHVKVPYHSHCMDPLREDLLDGLADLRPRSAHLPLYSTVTGTRIDGVGADANYWWQNVRATVLFAPAATQMIADGYTVFVELSPHPVLAGPLNELLAQQGQAGSVVPSLRRTEPDALVLRGSLGALYTHGSAVAWRQFYGPDSSFVRLPSYPWQGKSYWTESPEAREDRHYTEVHPLLGQRMKATHPTWELEVSAQQVPYLADHRIQDNVLLPGAAFVEMAMAAARAVYGEGDYAIEALEFRKALLLTGLSDPRLRTTLHQEQATVEISSYGPAPGGEAQWSLHATATVRQRTSPPPRYDLDALRGTCVTHVTRDDFYEQTRQMGFQYGPAFQAVQAIDTGVGRAVGVVRVPDVLDGDLAGYTFHPALIDAAFQVLLIAAGPQMRSGQPATYLPVGIDRIRVLAGSVTEMTVVAEIIEADERHIVSDIRMFTPAGDPLVEIEGFRAQSLEASTRLAPERIDKSLYELRWRPAPHPADEQAADEDSTVQGGTVQGGADETGASGTCLILTDADGVGEALAARLAESGQPAVIVRPADDTPALVREPNGWTIDPVDPAQFVQLIETLNEGRQITRVVHLWSLDSAFGRHPDSSTLERDQNLGVRSITHLVRALVQGGAQLPRLWLVTRRAQAVDESTAPVAIEQAPVWGLGRVIGHQEFKGMWGGLIDLDVAAPQEQAAIVASEILAGTDEDQVAFRGGVRYVPRLVESQRLTPPLPPVLRPDGSYLVTGAFGALGLLVARFLVQRGATRLILMARTKLPERATWNRLSPDDPHQHVIGKLMELERLGATLVLAAVDVADEEQLTAWLARYEAEARPPIRGVVHAAGVVQDELLLRMGADVFDRVLRPKVRGGGLLHHLLRDQPLEHFVLFSSTGSVIASPGQGNYASGNAFLDALAAHRQALGQPALSIGWGPWSVGMVEQLHLEEVYTRRGIELITPEAGMQILARVLGQRPAHLVAISANWATVRESSAGQQPSMFADLGVADGDPDTDDGQQARSLLGELSAAPASERVAMVTVHLQEMAARVLQLDPSAFGVDEPLTALGLDSMMAIEVKHRIDAAVGIDLSVLEFLQGATITGLATQIVASLRLDETVTSTSDDPDMSEVDSGLSVAEIEALIALSTDDELERLLTELEQESS